MIFGIRPYPDRLVKNARASCGIASLGLRKPYFAVLTVLASLLMLLAGGCTGGNDAPDFNRDIRPVLNRECVGCHGGVHRESGLSLLFRDDALRPAESGEPAITPGDAAGSELIRRISHPDPSQRMPAEGASLSREEIARFREWIDAGAEWTPHWAYIAPDPGILDRLPRVERTDWPTNEIDRFVLARLEASGLEPSGPASCPTLLRRVSLDLTGLPPTIEDVDSVCSDPAGSYESYVNTLLDRPSFGERWAAMWLDLARYADSQGYEADHYRSIWRYRDWVIDAFNSDLPFDRFTIEQLAGDLLPNPTKEQLISTAFSRNSMTNTEGGTDDEEHRVAAVIDRLNTTWEVWQGTAIRCAQCHGHPYDPIKHDEYYEALAFFNNTADWDQTDDRPVMYEFADVAEDEGHELVAALAGVNEDIRRTVRSPEEQERRREWETRLGDPHVIGKVLNTRQNKLLRIAKVPEDDRTGRQEAVLEDIYVDVVESMAPLRRRREELKAAIAELGPIVTPVMQELPGGERRETHVFDRGNFLVQLEEVEPDVPASMPSLADEAPRNRLGLAEWLVSPENSLTARVIVNRFWAQLFGLGLVETLEDFGTQGTAPSHPELLDWLAVTFRETDAWSVKALLRRIVLSSTYRQASTVAPEKLAADPRDRLLSRSPRVRLSAEQLRDQALAVSGLLSRKMHGPSVMPYQPEGIWQNPYSNEKWEISEGEDRYRRALYTHWRRSAPYPAMVAFDTPTREFCVSRRPRTNTPLQALVTLNDPAFVEAAAALARRMLEHAESGEPAPTSVEFVEREAVRYGFRRALARPPDAPEEEALMELYREASAGSDPLLDSARLSALTVVANAIMNLDEFITRG